MRKFFALMITLCLLLSACGASAEVSLNVFTPFADMDFAAGSYMNMMVEWEKATGGHIEDYSGVTDDVWFDQLYAMVEEGTADVLIMPVGSSLTYEDVMTVEELMEAAPQLGLKSFSAMREADGSVLLSPVRLGWEALYINTDVLAANGLAVPTTFDELLGVCRALAQKGVTPISNALGDWAEIVLDCAALAGASEAEFGLPTSMEGAQRVLVALAQSGAFGADMWTVSDETAEERFLSGEAAMRIDADWLSESIPASRYDVVTVTQLPAMDGKARTAAAGTPTFGVTITRTCFEDDARREAALSFVALLLQSDNAAKLATACEGELGRSIALLNANATDCTGLLYDLTSDTFDLWAEGVMDTLMSL